jgi:hypothetical protein
LAGDLENFVGFNGFEKRDPARVVIAFGRARVSATWSKGTVWYSGDQLGNILGTIKYMAFLYSRPYRLNCINCSFEEAGFKVGPVVIRESSSAIDRVNM